MTKKKFQCRIEELPVIGEFVLSSVLTDLVDFQNFSPRFTSEYLDGIKERINVCKSMVSAIVVTNELKATTSRLKALSKGLRPEINALDVYFKMAKEKLDVAPIDTGLREVRVAINKGNTEGTLHTMRNMLTVAQRNRDPLTAVGMRPAIISDLKTSIEQIEMLNIQQNDLISRRGRLVKTNIDAFNSLWEEIKELMQVGKALYRNRDASKLKDYTLTRLRQRINAEGIRK